jgi:predicted translin family RNA/ssDNA-binding protein
MEQYDRKSDEEIHLLVARVAQLEGEVKLLRTDFEDHCVLDEKTHEKMLNGIADITQELLRHTTQEEKWQASFKLMLEKIDISIEGIKLEVEKTKPIVQTYNDLSGAARITKAIVETIRWVIPMVVGIGAAYMWILKGY